MNVGPGVFKVAVNGIDIGAVIYGGGIEFVANGGQAIDAMVNMGGNQFVMSGGKAYDTMVNFGGTQTVGAGGQAFSTPGRESGGHAGRRPRRRDRLCDHQPRLAVPQGRVLFQRTDERRHGVPSPSGATRYYTKVDANSLQDDHGEGNAQITDVESGGKQNDETGGIVDYTDVHAGGVELLMSSRGVPTIRPLPSRGFRIQLWLDQLH